MSAITEPTVGAERATRAEAEGRRQRDGASRRFTCACGQAYRVSGLDRHRINWPLDAHADQPVLDGCCLRCRRPLP